MCNTKSYVFLQDRYAYGRYTPPIDPIQNWFLTNAEIEDGYTVLEFYRNFITCDDCDLDILVRITEYYINLSYSHHASSMKRLMSYTVGAIRNQQ